jgi:hypothetical protein
MEFNSIFDIVLGAAIVAVGLYVHFTRGGSVSVGIGDSITAISDIAHEAQLWVRAAEQLYESGQLPAAGTPGEAKLAYALAGLRRILPGVPEATLRASIEVAVSWLHAATDGE